MVINISLGNSRQGYCAQSLLKWHCRFDISFYQYKQTKAMHEGHRFTRGQIISTPFGWSIDCHHPPCPRVSLFISTDHQTCSTSTTTETFIAFLYKECPLPSLIPFHLNITFIHDYTCFCFSVSYAEASVSFDVSETKDASSILSQYVMVH